MSLSSVLNLNILYILKFQQMKNAQLSQYGD